MNFVKFFRFAFLLAGAASLFSAGPQVRLRDLYRKGSLKLVEVARVHSDALPGGMVLGDSLSIGIGGNDDLLVCDLQQNKIFVFDASGNFLRAFGREGSGPGDLKSPAALACGGSRVIVWEIQNDRFSLFRTNGEFLMSKRYPMFSYIQKIRGAGDGGFITEQLVFSMQEQKEAAVLYLLSGNGELLRQLYVHPVKRSKFISRPIAYRVPQPFPRRISWDVGAGGRIYIGYQDENVIEIHDPLRGRIASFSYAFPREKVTAADRKEFMDGLVISGGNAEIKKTIRENVDFPEFKPAYHGILADPQGNVLVFAYPPAAAGGKEILFYAFNERGEWIGRVQVAGIRFGADAVFTPEGDIWTRVRDAEDELQLVKYRFLPAQGNAR